MQSSAVILHGKRRLIRADLRVFDGAGSTFMLTVITNVSTYIAEN